MAGEGGARGGLGWAILAAALAVPGFLFYNWWSHLKSERDHAVSAKASKRADGGVFQTPPSTGRLVNPMAPSTSTPSGLAPAPAAAAVAEPRLPPAAPAAMTPAPTSTAPAHGAVPSAVSVVVLARDPMLSPLDEVRLQEAALAEEERLRALAEANRPHPRVRHVQPGIETRIDLQGIVAKSDGDNVAIINGSMVSLGESIAIDGYAGKVRIVKIGSAEVTLEYKGRRIKLRVNSE